MKWRTYRKAGRQTWTVRGLDHLDVERTVGAFADRGLSLDLAKNVARLVTYRQTGEPIPEKLHAAVRALPARIRDRLASLGIIGTHTRPILDLLDEYARDLSARGNTAKHRTSTRARIVRILDAAGAPRLWSDVRLPRIRDAIAALRDARARQRDDDGEPAGLAPGAREATALTKNHHLRDVKSFARWCVRQGYLAESPVETLEPLAKAKVDATRRVRRRALTVEEARRLLDTTAAGPVRGCMPGPERALFWRLLIETGLRSAEARSLTRAAFDLEAGTVTVLSGYTKNRKPATLPLRPAMVEALRSHLEKRMPAAPAFDAPSGSLAHVLRRDLLAAGIATRDERGRVVTEDASGRGIDVHSLRYTCATWLARAGVAPAVAQKILRHASVNLTLGIYTTVHRDDETTAVSQLPDLDASDDATSAAE